jgi:hypothetical protein
MTFTFGMVIGMDIIPAMRLMLMVLDPGLSGNQWRAMILADPDNESGWSVGNWVVVAPEDSGIIVIEHPLDGGR